MADFYGGLSLSTATGKFVLKAGDTMTGALTITSPNTLTLGAMTAGSVIFAGTAGLLSQNNANFFWDNTNNRLGIGTTAPLYPIHLNGTAGTNGIALQPGTRAYTITTFDAGGNMKFGRSDSGSSMNFYPDATVVKLVGSITAGNIDVSLEAVASASGGIYLTPNPSAETGSVFLGYRADGIIMGGANTKVARQLTIKPNVGQTIDQFQVQNSAGTALTVIDINGKVGIGTTGPAQALHVVGRGFINDQSNTATTTFQIQGNATSNNILQVGTSVANKILVTPASITLVGTTYIEDSNGGSLSVNSNAFAISSISRRLDLQSASTFALTLNATGGNVGIGTTAPSTLLHVGLAGTTLGTIGVAGNTSGLITIQPAAAAGTWTMTLPTSAGTANQYLQTNGSGVTTWAAAAATNDVISLTGQNASITSANFANSATAGLYRVSFYMVCTTADLTAGSIALSVTFNDGTAARTLTGTGVALTSTANKTNKFTNTDIDGTLIRLGSGNVAWSTTLTGIAGLAFYSVYITFQRLN